MRRISIAVAFFILAMSYSYADEGMWMLNMLKKQKLAEMQKMGLKLEDYDIYNPDGASLKDAVVQFGGGCTGEVISSKGLVLTNHHCGYGQIQNHSTIEHNYLDDGFWANNLSEELPNPGLTVTFIERIDDVTDYVKDCLKRDEAQDSLGVFFLSPSYLNGLAIEKVGEDFLRNNAGTDVEIKPFFEGNQYYMFTKKIYSDVRLVGAPPSSIGKFGADTDNWMWPRHTGDFSIFRIYADKDGNPADYSEDNVPLRPKRWLKIWAGGIDEGDFAMIIGFPGTTNKYYTSWEVAERSNIDNDVRIKMREARQETMLKEMLNDSKVKIKYAAKYSSSTNGYKNAIGTNWAIGFRNFEHNKMIQQNRVADWSRKSNKMEYADAIGEIECIVKDRADLRYRLNMLYEGVLRAVEFATVPTKTADRILLLLEEGKPEEANGEKDMLVNDYNRFADKDYDRQVDMKVAKTMLREYINNVPKEKQPEYFGVIYSDFGGDSDKFVDYIFEKSVFGSESNLKSFVEGDIDEEKLKNDPMFSFSRSVRAELLKLRTELSKYDIPFAKARRKYLEGILSMDNSYEYFPDANLTMRLAYGHVKGYKPGDAIYYSHQTTLDGVMQKEDPDNWEFVVPDKLKQLYSNSDFNGYAMGDGRMPVNFVATTHTTGGNSGSPVMNGRGELIGINFDRNWEGVGGDIQYLPDYQRSIIVDVRYVLFIIDKYADATHLIDELDIVRK
ncbi:MAG: S46 family peptidase [Fermentimonas sp.]|jgi:hypothetical protein